jgi:hypothetical protein
MAADYTGTFATLRLEPSPQCLHEPGRFWSTHEDLGGCPTMSKQLAPNRLRPQLARRQLVTQTHPFGFDSRRLHHSTRSRCSLARAVGAVARQVGFGLRPRLTGSTPAASTTFPQEIDPPRSILPPPPALSTWRRQHACRPSRSSALAVQQAHVTAFRSRNARVRSRRW